MEESLCASAAECQLHLLEHMEALHNQTSTRMDLIERELDGNTHSHTQTLTLTFSLTQTSTRMNLIERELDSNTHSLTHPQSITHTLTLSQDVALISHPLIHLVIVTLSRWCVNFTLSLTLMG